MPVRHRQPGPAAGQAIGQEKREAEASLGIWSGKRVSNSRPQPWQGCALPTELFPHFLAASRCCCAIRQDLNYSTIFCCCNLRCAAPCGTGLPVPHTHTQTAHGTNFWRRGPESNRTNRICNPGHNRFATAPGNRFPLTKKGSSCFPFLEIWSGKRVSNSRPQPWQGCALPTELFPHLSKPHIVQRLLRWNEL